MKKGILAALLAATVVQGYAEDEGYDFLTLKTHTGVKTQFAVEGLNLRVQGTSLVVSNDETTKTFPLTSLASMYFSTTGPATAIEGMRTTPVGAAAVSVYSLSGVLVGSYDSLSEAQGQLPQGVYVMKQGTQTTKICIK